MMNQNHFKYEGPRYSPSLLEPLPDFGSSYETMSQLELLRGLKNEPDNIKELEAHYKAVSEIYAMNFDNVIESCQAFINSDGAIAEMFLEVITFEQAKGITERSTRQKDRITLIQKSIELLRKYFNKFEQAKMMLNNSIDERRKLLLVIKEQREQIEKLNKQLHF